MSEEKEHVVAPIYYVMVLIALMVLLLVTIAFAFVDLDHFTTAHHLGAGWNTAIAITIAIMKAMLIFLIFMHVRWGTHMTWAFAASGFVWLMIMLSLTMSDYYTRRPPRAPFGTPDTATPSTPEPITIGLQKND